MSVPDTPRLAYSITEAGAMLGLSKKAARSAAQRGTLPTVKLGGRRFVTTTALARLLGERADNTAAPEAAVSRLDMKG